MKEVESDLSEIQSYFIENIELGSSEKNLINAVDKYLQKNYYELYDENNLEVIFKKAREDKNVELKMFNTISKFILN